MYIEKVPNRNSKPAILLREGHRVDGKVVKRTIANLSSLPAQSSTGFSPTARGGRSSCRSIPATRATFEQLPGWNAVKISGF